MNQIDSLLVHDPSDPDGDTSCAGTTTDTVESESEEDEAEDGLLEVSLLFCYDYYFYVYLENLNAIFCNIFLTFFL